MSTSTGAKPAHHKRLDLQGLRAVAVLLVALNHANVPFLKGGYIGVDVFFVLSGYFITGILLREGFGRAGAALGAISIPNFYARRARRILPAACVTLLVTAIAVYIVYDLDKADFLDTKSVLDDAFSASLFFANFHFAHTATNYFVQAAASLPSPFQHFWSLSVEEQMYFVWPTLLTVVFFLCRRGTRTADRQRRTATWVCGLLMAGFFAASLIYSIAYTHHNPQAAYFSTPARVYEFAIGGLLSLLALKAPKLPERLLALTGCVGLAMIIIAAVRYSSHTSFPGVAALLPSVGAGMVILGGMAPLRVSAASVLALKPMTWVGDRSYAFYLWHYPVLIVVWRASGHELPWGENLGLLAGALALSALTFELYENPLRFAKWLQRGWRTAVMACVSIGLSLLAILIPISAFDSTLTAQAKATRQLQQRVQRASATAFEPAAGQPDPTSLAGSTPIPAVVAAVKAAQANKPLPKTLLPAFAQLQTNSYDTPGDCQPAFGPGVTPPKLCRLGDASSKQTVVMIGDSHSGHWDPAVIADGKAQHFAMVTVAKSGCQLSTYDHNQGSFPCSDWYRWAIGEDKKLHPVATIVSFLYQDSYEQDPSKYVARLKTILSQVTNPILIADFPYQNQQPSICLTSNGATQGRCSTPVPNTYGPFVDAVQKMTTSMHVPVIPTLQWFCADGTCPMVVDNTIVVHDKDHMTEDYVDDLTKLFSMTLNPILRRYESTGTGAAGTTTTGSG
jgi:peptidoglycan/LPS O-acetylase OafA/YrhL